MIRDNICTIIYFFNTLIKPYLKNINYKLKLQYKVNKKSIKPLITVIIIV